MVICCIKSGRALPCLIFREIHGETGNIFVFAIDHYRSTRILLLKTLYQQMNENCFYTTYNTDLQAALSNSDLSAIKYRLYLNIYFFRNLQMKS